MITIMTPRPTPTPKPAFAPVLSPSEGAGVALALDGDEVSAETAVALDTVDAMLVVAVAEEVTRVVLGVLTKADEVPGKASTHTIS